MKAIEALALVGGHVDEELLKRNEYLAAENEILNAFCERWVLSVKSELLSRLVIFGEEGVRRALSEYVAHFHEERNHQGLDNVIPFPLRDHANECGEVKCSERLGGLLKIYRREAA